MVYKRFRRKFIPPFKSALSSVADLVGDWAFLLSVRGETKYDTFLMAFAAISTVMTILTIFSLLSNGCCKTNIGCGRYVKLFLGLEMIFEDIPQLVLTSLVRVAMTGPFSAVAIFNLTTSGFNFVFNLLDMAIPLDDEDNMKN